METGLVVKPSHNIGFEQWLVLFFLAGNYSKGYLHIFTTNYKRVATTQSRGTLAHILTQPGKFNNLMQQMIKIIFVELWKNHVND